SLDRVADDAIAMPAIPIALHIYVSPIKLLSCCESSLRLGGGRSAAFPASFGTAAPVSSRCEPANFIIHAVCDEATPPHHRCLATPHRIRCNRPRRRGSPAPDLHGSRGRCNGPLVALLYFSHARSVDFRHGTA